MTTDPAIAYDWSFALDWSTGFKVTRSYRTDIFTSRAGKEQRRATRTSPRLQFEGSTQVVGDEYREFNGLMTKRQHRPFTAPDWSRRVALIADADNGDSLLTLADTPGWLVAGRAVYLFHGGRPVKHIVDTVGSGTVSLIDPVDRDWVAGSVLLPGPVGFLGGEMTLQNPTNSVAVVPLLFGVEPVSEPAPTPPDAAVTLGGREVCTLRTNWAATPEQTLVFAPEFVDYQRGPITYTFPVNFPSKIRRLSVMAKTAAEAQEIADLFDRMKGRRGEFYLPSGENDLPPKTALSSAAATLRVAGTDTATFYADSTVYKAVCVQRRNGARIYRQVSSITTNAGDTVLTMTANWGVTLQPSDIVMISWMPVWRFASDDLTIEFVTSTIATADFNLRMLEDLTPESLA